MIAVLLAAVLALPQEPVKVSAILSNNRPIVGEPTMLRITIETRDTIPDRIVDPVMPAGIEIVETQDYSETRISYPGGRNNVTERRLILVARVPGQFTIPSAMVHASGRVWATRALPITVSGGDAPGAAPDIGSRIDVVISPERVYVGQQVLLEATAAFSRGLRSQQTRPATYTAPSPAGFWIHDVAEPLSVGMQTIEGELYETQTFRRVYFPLSAGTFRMPPARLQFELRRGFLSSAESFELVSDSPAIEVLPVPAEGRPDSFRGAVGQYTARASSSPAQVAAGEAASLVLEIEGVGNVKALPAPPLPPMPGVEVQPPTEDAETDSRGSDVGGIKRFTWVLIPEQPGRVTIPPIEYVYFNPVIEQFEIARTQPLTFDVLGSITSGAASSTLAPLARSPSRVTNSLLRSPLFLAAQVVPLLLLLAVLRRRTIPVANAPVRTERTRPDAFAALRNNAAMESSKFWPLFDASVRNAVADSLQQPSLARAPTTDIATALARHGIANATTTTILDLLKEAERVRFARDEQPRMNVRDYVERAERAIRAMDRGRSGGSASLVVLAMIAAAIPGATPAHALQTRETFETGVSLYERGEFAGAASAFETHLETRPSDANAWYDLGNAQWSAGERGRAVHAWVRALRLEPRHSGARQNLATATGTGALTAAPPSFALSLPQAALVFSGLWWLTVLACVHLALRRRSLMPAGLVAAVLFGCAGIAALFGLSARDAGVALEDTSLLMAPALKAEAIGSLPAGTVLEVLEERDGWTRVRVAGTEGWTESVVIGT